MTRTNDVQHGGDHYHKGGSLQHWDLCATFSVGYLEGTATKYLFRWRMKNGLGDLHKASHYIDKIAEMMVDIDYKAGPGVPRPILRAFLLDNAVIDHFEQTLIQILLSDFDASDIKSAQSIMKVIIDAARETSP